MSKFSASVGELTDTISRGLQRDLKIMIKAKLLASVDQTLEDMAIELAENIVLSIDMMTTPMGSTFGPETHVVVNFNLKDPPMVYDTRTKTVKRRDVVER